MPTNGTARGLSALAGFGLFCTAIVLCYLNSTTSNFFWSSIYISAIIVVSLATASKWAMGLGVENGVAVFADKVASVVPWVALYFNGIQALHYNRDGLDGFMAGVAIISLVFVVGFGVADSVASLLGQKYRDVSKSLAEAGQRVSAASDALHGSRR
jgi:hypothetical protein